jgi:hypothetical protein
MPPELYAAFPERYASHEHVVNALLGSDHSDHLGLQVIDRGFYSLRPQCDNDESLRRIQYFGLPLPTTP